MARIDIGNGTLEKSPIRANVEGLAPPQAPTDWITASLARLAPELQTNHPPFSPFERLSLEMMRGAFELIALIADGSAARGGNQARIEELCAQFGIELPASVTSTATETLRQPEQSAAEET